MGQDLSCEIHVSELSVCKTCEASFALQKKVLVREPIRIAQRSSVRNPYKKGSVIPSPNFAKTLCLSTLNEIINSTDSPISFHRFADFIPQIRRFHSTDSPISFFSERLLCGCDTVCCRDVSPVGKLRKNFIDHTLFPAEPLCTHPVAQVCFQFTVRPLVYL